MTNSDTIRRVARPRGVLTPDQEARLGVLQAKAERYRAEFRRAVVETLGEGASFNEVSKATGLSKDTLQRWKREAADSRCCCDRTEGCLVVCPVHGRRGAGK